MARRSNTSFDTQIGAEDDSDGVSKALEALKAHKRNNPSSPANPAVAETVEAVSATQEPPKDDAIERNPDLAFSTMGWTEVQQLPSFGRAYPEGATIAYRPFTLGEAIKAEQSKFTIRQTYEQIMQGLRCSFDPWQLTLPDILFLGLTRRIATLGDTKVTVNSVCPHCQSLNQTTVETSALDFDGIKAPKLPMKVKFSFGTHTFSALTIAKYLELVELGLETDTIGQYAAMCTSMSIEEAMKVFSEMSLAKDIRLIRHADELVDHELKPLILTCPAKLGEGEAERVCGGSYAINLDSVASAFTLPFRGWDESDLSDEIEFGD